jgi:hypothetical protein
MDTKLETWNDGSLYKAGSPRTVAREFAKYKSDLVAVHAVRCTEGGSQQAEDYTFLCGNGNAKHHLGTVC